MSELKPCPFCGGEAKLKEYLGSTFRPPSKQFVCEDCDAAGPKVTEKTNFSLGGTTEKEHEGCLISKKRG